MENKKTKKGKVSTKGKVLAKGFTLTEILVVVLVVAVLAAVAYPLYTKSMTNARAVEAVNLIEIVKNKQIEQYARSGGYYDEFSEMGQFTNNPTQETPSNAMVQIKDYTLSLNTAQNCITTAYKKRGTRFSFSSSYEDAGLGCEGDICQAFGDVVGTTKEVCNCGENTCPGGFQNPETCECGDCNPGDSRACGNCGTQTCTSAYKWGDCGGTGVCSPGSRQNGTCIYGGHKICTTSCAWGSCQNVGVCNPGAVRTCGACGTQTCSSSYRWGTCSDKTKPGNDTQNCGNCGTQTRTYTCSKTSTTATWVAGTWGTCSGQGACSPKATRSCGSSGTQTCDSSCAWGAACTGQTCTATKPATSESCGNCGTKTRTVTCDTTSGTWTTGTWGACGGEGVCKPNATQSCGSSGTQTCTSSCAWGTACTGQTCTATKPTTIQICGTCGTQTRTVTCNTSTGLWKTTAWSACSDKQKPVDETQACGNCGKQTRTYTCSKTSTTATWVVGAWGACGGEGACKPNATRTCGSSGTQTCSSSCAWGTACTGQTCTATKPTTIQICGTCGTQTRTVTCNTSTGSWTTTAWSACSDKQKPVDETQACGNCGKQTRTYTCSKTSTTATWVVGAWGACGGEGACKPNATRTCGSSGTQTCNSSCAWGTACTGQTCTATKPVTSQKCGNCGTQTRTVTCNASTGSWTTGTWATCSGQGACSVGATRSCGSSGTQTCSSSCAWGTACTGQTCTATKPITSQKCGNCGTQTRSVTCNASTGSWSIGGWATCSGQGACSVGAKETKNCASGYTGTQTRTCSSSCAWGSWTGTCTPVAKECTAATKPITSQKCGNCGTQTRTVTCDTSTGLWKTTTWGTCSGQGVCSVGATTNTGCSYGGKKTCTSSCQWGACTGGGVCNPNAVRTCGTCGTQTCTSSYQWGKCYEAPRLIDTTKSCGRCGTQTISYTCSRTSTSASWVAVTGACTGERGTCNPGDIETGSYCDMTLCQYGINNKGVNVIDCVGRASRYCSNSCQWVTTNCYNPAPYICCGAPREGEGGIPSLANYRKASIATYGSSCSTYPYTFGMPCPY